MSPSQIAGFGLSITPGLGGGGYTAGAIYDVTPGQTTNPIFDYSAYDFPDYSPSYNYTGNGYSYNYELDYSNYDYNFNDYSAYNYSDFDYSTADLGFPIVLDLDGTGLKIDPLSSSNTYFDMAGDGYQHRTAWAGAGNGVLVLDLAGTGQITQRNQVMFTDWDPTASSDMQALANVFDTNHNGKLDAGDEAFASFKILVTNADGTTTLKTLAEAGVLSIDLIENAVTTVLPDGSQIQGQANFTRTDGTSGTAATVAFIYDSAGYAVTRTVTHNADGSTTINNKALNADGTLASETTTVTSANGLSRTITTDLNGDGVTDQVQTIVTVVNGNGSTTETLTNKTGANVVLDSTVTTTSADRTQVSITRDSNGNGVADQTEQRTISADGSTSTIISDLNQDGSLKGRTTSATSIDGHTRTVAADIDGNATTDLTTTDASVFNAGVRTRTVTVTGPDGAVLSRSVTTTNANGQTTSIVQDLDGDGLTDLTQSFAFAAGAGGSTITTESDSSRNGALLATVVTTLSADGLSKVVAIDNNGDGQTDLTTSDVTVVGSGARTQTVTQTNGDGSLRSQTVVVKGEDGRSRTTQSDLNGDSHLDLTRTIVIDGAGVSTDTTSNLNADGSLIGKSIVTTSASGLAVTTQRDLDGDGTIDLTATSLTVKNGDGSSTMTMADYSASGKVLDTTIATTSANGLTSTIRSDVDGDGVFDVTMSEVKVINGDGSRVETVRSTNTNGSLRSESITAISADRLTTTVTTDANGDGYIDQRRATAVQSNGTIVDTVTLLNPDKSVTSQTTSSTSANGLLRTARTDLDGDGVFDLTRTDNTVLNANGSRAQTISETNANGSLRNRSVIATSADGYTTTMQTDSDGNGVFERTTTSDTTFNADGSRTVSAVSRSASGATLATSSVTTSASGLTTSTTADLNGDGIVDRLGSGTILQNADGSTVETASKRNAADQSLRSETVTTTSADRLTVTTTSDINGDGAIDQSQTIATASDGTVTNTLVTYNPDGSRTSSTQTQTSANGLLTVTSGDLNGDLVADVTTVARKVLNADGSTTLDTDFYAGVATLTGSETVVTSADGRSVTTTTDIDGDGRVDLTKTTVKVLNADGSIVETVTEFNQDGTQRDKVVTTTSADGRTVDVSVILDSSGLVKYQKKTTIQNDGSALTVVTYPNISGTPIFASEVDTRITSADGLSSSISIVNSTNNYYDVASNTVLNNDGSRTTSHLNANVFQYDVSETVSANGLNKTVQWTGPSFYDIPDLALNGTDTTVFNADGSATRTVTNTIVQATANTSSVTDKTITTTSGDGLTSTTQLDINNDGVFERTETMVKALDGSTVQTVAQNNSISGALIQKDVLSTSFDGRQQTLQRDEEGDGVFDHIEASVVNADGSRTTTITDTTAGGALLERFVSTTSANGLSKTLSMDVDGDGDVDFVEKTTTTLNADGTTTTINAEYLGNGALREQSITAVSANGLATTTQYDLNGDGVIDETQTDITAYPSNGTKTRTVTTRYADGTLKDSATTTITQNAYKTITTTDFDLDGDGVIDRNEITSIDQDGYRVKSIQYYTDGQSVARIDTGTSPDGLTTYFPVYVPVPADGTWAQVGLESLFLMPHANGSYFYQISGTDGQTFIHTIDSNNVDNWVWTDPGTITYHTLRIDLATEEKLFDEAGRLYDTVLDRSMSQAETQKLIKYISSDAVLNATALANALMVSTEFTQKYGTLTDTQFIERAYQNAYGRAATLAELTQLLTQLNNGSLTRAALVIELAESTEHRLHGNEHLVTNNSGVSTSSYALDHSNDRQIIAAIIQNLYDAALDRQATASEVTTQGDKILSDAKTQAQVAADILALAEFATKYGTLTNNAFVAQIFQNALGRAPTAAEQAFWTGALDAATVTRADLLDAIAQSAEHLEVIARPIGTAGNDTIYSRDGADIIDGLAGTNTVDYSQLSSPGVTANLTLGTGIQANGAVDQLTNIQNLTGSAGADSLTGNTGANVLMGGDGNDTLDGGDGNDTLDGGAGNDALIGGAGTDTASYATAASGVTVSLGVAGAQATGGAGTDTLSGFENLTGSAFDDTLTGSAGTNVLSGKAGNDSYVVQDTADVVTELVNEGIDTVLSSVTYTLGANVENLTLTGTAAINGTGNALDNVLTGNSAINTLAGGAGNDSYIVQNTGDVVTEAASAGTDTVQSSATYTLGANVENLTLTGTDAIDGTGNALDNVLTGNSGTNTLAGGAGNDSYIIQNATDVVTEAASGGTDTIVSSVSYTLSANVESLTLTGQANLNGTGNALNNVITANSGDNVLDGSTGTDAVSYASALSGVTVSLAVTGAQATGGSGTDTLTGFEDLTGSSFNDTLTGSAGTNVLAGRGGDDTYIVQDTTDVVTELASEGTDTVLSSVTYTLGANVENLTLTGTAAINGTGNALDNIITGNSATNTLAGGTGNDTYIIQNTAAVITEAASGGTDIVHSSATYTLGANVENLTLTGTAAINGTGNALDNVLTGNSATNTLAGGAGNDSYIIQNTTDVVTEAASAGTDTIISSVSYTISANVENLTLTGEANLNGTGNTLNNIITANSGNNVLDGGTGTDTVSYAAALAGVTVSLAVTGAQATGGSGTDTLTGFENLTGSSFNDTLTGAAGANVLTGRAGNDTYIVQDTADVVTELASEGTDTVLSSVTYTLGANVENLTLTGTAAINGTGNDLNNIIIANAGNNVINAGAGVDTVSYAAATTGVTVSLAVTTAQATGGSGSDTLSNIENIIGSAFNDTLTGSSATNTLTGGLGNDTYIVTSNNDTVVELANEGIDTIQTGSSFTSAGYEMRAHVENLTLTGTANLNGIGNSLNNVMTGNSGANTLDGGGGNDTLIGGAGNDTYIVNSTLDVVTEAANAGTDTIRSWVTYTASSNVEALTLLGEAAINATGNTLANTLTGNAGDNLLDGGAGNDTMAGGAGNDSYIVDSTSDLVTEAASAGTDTIRSSVTYTASANVENLTLTGTAAINATGNALDNLLTGNSAVNTLTGGDGNDTLDGGAGNDTLVGGAGNDTYVVDNASDVVTEAASAGTDTIQSSVTYTASANVENLTLTGTAAINATGNTLNNVLAGNAAANVLDGGAGNDTLVGGAGNDIYIVDSTSDIVVETAGAGTDTIQSSVTYTASANVENLTLTGAAAINAIGNALANILTGNAANNVLNGGAGDDTMAGGAGNDSYVVDSASDIVTEAAGAGTDTIQSSVTYTASANVENLTLTGTAAINATGNALDNVLAGNAADNVLDGGAGNDTLAGGAGNDSYVVDSASDIVTEAAGAGTDTIQSSVTYTASANVENLTLTGTAAINATGNTLDNVLTGNAADNVLDGGAGNDTMAGGAGNDTYIVDSASDVVTEATGAGTDTIQSSVTYTASADVENLQLTGTAAINAIGNTLANVLTGNAADNVLDGGAGADTLIGGGGNDLYIVDSLSDAVTEDAEAGTDTVQSSVTYALAANVENLTLTGADAIDGTGNALGNVLTGNTAANLLRGGDGNDVLTGGQENDTLEGSEGDDIAAFSGASTEYQITVNPDGTLTVSHLGGGSDGTDTLSGIERLQFSDGIFDAPQLPPPPTIVGDAGNNNLIGTGGDDLIFGDAGDDILDGRGGNDVLDGGLGADTAYYSASPGPVTIDLAAGTADGGDATGDTLLNIENVTGSDFDDQIAGDAAANVLDGGYDGNDVLTGLGGDDRLEGGYGEDTAVFSDVSSNYQITLNPDGTLTVAHLGGGSDGTDTLSGIEWLQFSDGVIVAPQPPTIVGDAGNNHLIGTGGDDHIFGDAGDDILDGRGGNDVLDGGLGADTAYYSASPGAVTIDLAAGTAGGGDATGDTLLNIENVTGSDFDDQIAGDAAANRLSGGYDGNDLLAGRGGDDTLEGGYGDDLLDGGEGDDLAVFSDIAANYQITALANGTVTVTHLDGGTDGADTLQGVERLQFLDGIIDTPHAQPTQTIVGNAADDILNGGGDSDVIYGMGGNDQLNGGDGDDFLIGGMGEDRIDGGAGIDAAVFSDVADNYSFEWYEGQFFVWQEWGSGADVMDVLTGVEFLQFADKTIAVPQLATPISGDAGNNILIGTDANDTILGGDGDDTLTGGGGYDALDGGAGTDTAVFAGVADDYGAEWYRGRLYVWDLNEGFEREDELTNVEFLQFADRTIAVPQGPDLILGDGGNNTLTGTAFDDLIHGGDGDDVLTGGGGDDRLDGGAGTDTAVYLEAAANYYVQLWNGQVYVWHGSEAEGVDIMTGVEFIQFADMTMPVPTPAHRHYGDDGDNIFIGETGYDVMYGAGGDDILESGLGSDLLYGGAGTDTAVFSDVLANYQFEWHEDHLHVVQLNADQNNLDSLWDIEFLQFADVTISLPANPALIAGDGNDNVLTGTAGDDMIQGGAGDDAVTGGGGYDLIYGGAGIDTAVFSEDSANYVIEWHLDHSHVSHVGGSQADGTYSLTDIEFLQFADITIAAPAEPLTQYGSLGDDTISGAGGFDTLYGRHGNDVLDGGRGDDKLSGGLGDDRYIISPGDGQDIIFEQGGTDELLFDGSTDPSELWFDQRNSDLVISRLGTQDSVTIAGWFDPSSGSWAQVEDILAMNGSMALHAADVNSLISQMAAFSAQVGSDPSAVLPSDLPPEYQVAVNSVWQAA